MADWQIEDHLVAFSYRIGPLKTAMSKLLDAGVHVFRSLWPDAETPRSPIDLAEALMDAGMRLTEWRFSAGRAGADETLSYILSWYETIDFDLIQTCRIGGKFISDEEWIKRRQDLANFFTERADLHNFIPNLPFMEAPAEGEEGEGEGDEGSEADAAEDEVADDAEATSQIEIPASGSGTTTEIAPPA